MKPTLLAEDVVTRPMSRRAMFSIAVAAAASSVLGSCVRNPRPSTAATDSGDAAPTGGPEAAPPPGAAAPVDDLDAGPTADPARGSRPRRSLSDSDRGPTSDFAGS